jgi:hypothetical protein
VNWETHTVLAVLCGVVLVGAAFLPGQAMKNRVYSFVGGIVIAWYGVYVAQQTTGTYYFPVQIFFLPPLLVGYAVVKFVQARKPSAPRAERI